jgi:hypothetical protein
MERENKRAGMEPYSKDGKPKWKVVRDGSVRVTRAVKDEVKSANRSLKKGVRQEIKKEIRDELDKLGY